MNRCTVGRRFPQFIGSKKRGGSCVGAPGGVTSEPTLPARRNTRNLGALFFLGFVMPTTMSESRHVFCVLIISFVFDIHFLWGLLLNYLETKRVTKKAKTSAEPFFEQTKSWNWDFRFLFDSMVKQPVSSELRAGFIKRGVFI